MTSRFFKPLDVFWKWLEKEHKSLPERTPIIDCGCGQGDLVIEMREKKFPAIGCDPHSHQFFSRERMFELSSAFMPMGVEEFQLLKNIPAFLLVCRPCHSGFPAVLNTLRHPESHMFYIGLEHNLELDLDAGTYEKITTEPVGEDGEHIWKIHK